MCVRSQFRCNNATQPVSYTHLDVYKRQKERQTLCHLFVSVRCSPNIRRIFLSNFALISWFSRVSFITQIFIRFLGAYLCTSFVSIWLTITATAVAASSLRLWFCTLIVANLLSLLFQFSSFSIYCYFYSELNFYSRNLCPVWYRMLV